MPASTADPAKVFSQEQSGKGQGASYSSRRKPSLERGCVYYGKAGHLKGSVL